MSRKLISVFVMLILSVFTYGHLGLFQLARSKKYVYKPTYGPPGLITFVLRLRDSSSAWVILSRVTWYESFVAHTVILSCINPRQLSWDAPELASKIVAWLEREIYPWIWRRTKMAILYLSSQSIVAVLKEIKLVILNLLPKILKSFITP